MSKTRLTKKQQKLVVNNIRLLTSFFSDFKKRKFVPSYLEDDLASELCLNFCISALKYDEDYGAKFSTYAYWGFNKSIEEVYGRKKRNFDRYNFYSMAHIRNFAFLNIKKVEVEKDVLYKLIDEIDVKDRDKKIFIEYYSYKISQKKLGEKYNLTGPRIPQIISNIIDKLKRVVEERKLSKQDFYVENQE